MSRNGFVALFFLSALAATGRAAVTHRGYDSTVPSQDTVSDPVDFTTEVRPILERACFRCHGPHARRARGGLRMDGREALLVGGDSGPSIVDGDPDSSLLLQLVRHEIELFEMPPEEDDRLPEAEVELLARWIAQGADWPGGDAGPSDHREIDFDEGRRWWAFRPVTDPAPPEVSDPLLAARVANDVDRFVYAKLAEAGLPAAPEAGERTLLRRLYIDLLGLPPTFEEVEAYRADPMPDKWQRKVDELLARPEFGERWARRWLDVVRFAQTNGYERDEEKPYAWRYRDYVVDSFNADKPFDQFLREQLAGDELDEVTDEGRVATGFYHLGVWDSEPNDPEQALLDGQDDVLRVVTEGILGVTVGCARCHDHRTDPIRQQDYYSLLAFLRGVEPYQQPSFNFESPTYSALGDGLERRLNWERKRRAESELVRAEIEQLQTHHLRDYLEANFEAEVATAPSEAAMTQDEVVELNRLAAKFNVRNASIRRSMKMEDRHRLFLLEADLKRLESSYEGGVDWALCARESGTEPAETHVLHRGRSRSRRQLVEPSFPPVLCADDASALPALSSIADRSSGRRRALAEWVTDPDHPTTARVFANRVWQGLFGRGLVVTPNDFGATGVAPTHPELLDWLASSLVEGEWSVKQLHRVILGSAAYRASSAYSDPATLEIDPDNRLLWRGPLRRLDAESLHDSLLAVSGELNPERGGRGYFPVFGAEALAGMSRPGSGWGRSTLEQRNRRALYGYVKRGLLLPFMTVFDFVDSTNPQGSRASTTVASQALTLLNGRYANRNAEELAGRLIEAHGHDSGLAVRDLYRRLLQRDPTSAELDTATRFVERQAAGFQGLPERMTFRPAVPPRVEMDYLSELEAEELLDGPRDGWSYAHGQWGNEYNRTREASSVRGPLALAAAPELDDGRIVFDLTLEEGCTRAGFLMRASAAGRGAVGLQLDLDVEEQRIALLRLDSEQESSEIAHATVALLPGIRQRVAIELSGSAVRVWIAQQRILDVDDPSLPRASGRFGVRAVGEGLHLENVTLVGDRLWSSLRPDDPGDPYERALALLCLTTFNLNEFLYVE